MSNKTFSIPLHGKHGRGKFAIIDADDFRSLAIYHWIGHTDGSCYTIFYAGVNARTGKGLYQRTLMHRLIMQPSGGLVVDHINGDKLDNRKANLRVCTIGDNTRHQLRRRSDNTSGYRGVKKGKTPGTWDAEITINYKVVYLGRYRSKHDAARAYNKKVVEVRGEFANPNVIEDGADR